MCSCFHSFSDWNIDFGFFWFVFDLFLFIIIIFRNFLPVTIIFQKNSFLHEHVDAVFPSVFEWIFDASINSFIISHLFFFDKAWIKFGLNLLSLQVLRNEDKLVSLITDFLIPESWNKLFGFFSLFFSFAPVFFWNFAPPWEIELIIDSGTSFL